MKLSFATRAVKCCRKISSRRGHNKCGWSIRRSHLCTSGFRKAVGRITRIGWLHVGMLLCLLWHILACTAYIQCGAKPWTIILGQCKQKFISFGFLVLHTPCALPALVLLATRPSLRELKSVFLNFFTPNAWFEYPHSKSLRYIVTQSFALLYSAVSAGSTWNILFAVEHWGWPWLVSMDQSLSHSSFWATGALIDCTAACSGGPNSKHQLWMVCMFLVKSISCYQLIKWACFFKFPHSHLHPSHSFSIRNQCSTITQWYTYRISYIFLHYIISMNAHRI